MEACPNCLGHSLSVWTRADMGSQAICDDCLMCGPMGETAELAQAKWDRLPRHEGDLLVLRERIQQSERRESYWRIRATELLVDWCELIPVEWLEEMVPPELRRRIETLLQRPK